MTRLAQLCIVVVGLGVAGPASAAQSVRCPINQSPIAAAGGPNELLIVGVRRDGKASFPDVAPTQLVSCLASRTGRLKAPPRALTHLTPRGTSVFPEGLAYNAKLGEYRLISGTAKETSKGPRRQRLYVHRLGPAGGTTQLGKPLPGLPSGGGFRPTQSFDADIACARSGGRCMVVWVTSESASPRATEAIVGLRLRPGAKPLEVRAHALSRPQRFVGGDPSVVATAEGFVTAWEEESSGRSILLSKVITGSPPWGGAFPFYVAPAKVRTGRPALALFDRRRVGAVWSQRGDLRLRVFDPAAPRATVEPAPVTTNGGRIHDTAPLLRYDRAKQRFTVVWSRETGGKPRLDVLTRTVAVPTALLGRTRCLSCRRRWGHGRAEPPFLADVGDRTFAAWFGSPQRRARTLIARVP